jgi:hypothetical protein
MPKDAIFLIVDDEQEVCNFLVTCLRLKAIKR